MKPIEQITEDKIDVSKRCCKTCGNKEKLYVVIINPLVSTFGIKCRKCGRIVVKEICDLYQSKHQINVKINMNHHEVGKSTKICIVSNTFEDIFLALEKEYKFNREQLRIGIADDLGTYEYVDNIGDCILSFDMNLVP